MKTMATIKPNSNQSTSLLWTALPEDQQELLSGGAPQVSGGNGGNTGGGNTGGGSSGGSTGTSVIISTYYSL